MTPGTLLRLRYSVLGFHNATTLSLSNWISPKTYLVVATVSAHNSSVDKWCLVVPTFRWIRCSEYAPSIDVIR